MITLDYQRKILEHIKNDIDKLLINGKEVEKTVYLEVGKVIVKSVEINGTITSIIIKNKDGIVIKENNKTLVIGQNEKISISETIEVIIDEL